MRAAFSSWATWLGYNPLDIERGLAHLAGYGPSSVARIYNRDAFGRDAYVLEAIRKDPLRQLFADWAHYCLTGEFPKSRREPQEATVTPLLPSQLIRR
jgi:hypothetical protein